MVHMWQEVELSLFITGNTAMRYMNRWLDVWFGLPESRLHVGLEGSQISSACFICLMQCEAVVH